MPRVQETLWYTQKAGAVAFVKNEIASGEKSIESLVDGLVGTGVSRKNAPKALYLAVNDGSAVLASGDWSDGTLKKAGS